MQAAGAIRHGEPATRRDASLGSGVASSNRWTTNEIASAWRRTLAGVAAPEDNAADTAIGDAPTLVDEPRFIAPRSVIGRTIGRYEVLRPLGAGGMGLVYLARDPELDRRVAIKLVRPGRRGSRSRLLREGQAVARLSHPNVVTVHDVGEYGEDLFIAMEYVRGSTVGQWLETPRSWGQVLEVFRAAGRGLAAAHRAGLVHRDFKPDNVLLGDGRVVVSDFGLARADAPGERHVDDIGEIDATRTDGIVGTPAYMSPEQFRGSTVDARSDQFSFCIALWEGLYGVRPFETPTTSPTDYEQLSRAVRTGAIQPPPRDRAVPRRILRALRRGLSVEPGLRFASMEALLAALRPPDRRPMLAGATIAVVAIGIGLVAATRASPAPAAVLPSCEAEAARVDAIWNAAARERYGTAGRAEHVAEDVAGFDRFAARWSATARTVCVAGAAAPRRAPECLDAALGALGHALDRRHREYWPELPDPRACEHAQPAEVRELRSHLGSLVPSGAIAPDGARLAFAAGAPLHGLIGTDGRITGPDVLANVERVFAWTDADTLLARTDKGVVRIALSSGTRTALPWPADTMELADDAQLAAVDRDHAVVVLDPRREVARVPVSHVKSVAFEPGSRRLAIIDDDHGWTLIVLDLATGRSRRTALRVHGEAGNVLRVAWAAPARLVFGGSARPSDDEALWIADVADDGSVAGIPSLLLEPRRASIMDLLDVRGDRALVVMVDVPQQVFRVRGGETSRVGLLEGTVVAADAAARRFLTIFADEAMVVDASGEIVSRQLVRSPWAVFRDGEVWFGRGERDAVVLHGARERRLPGAPAGEIDRVRCGSGGGCFASWWRDGVLVHTPLLADAVAAPFEIAAAERDLDLAPDGRRALVMLDHELIEYDVISRRQRILHHEPDCELGRAQWTPSGESIVYLAECDHHRTEIRIARAVPGASDRTVATVTTAISGLAALGEDDLVYSAVDYQSRLTLVEGAIGR